MHRHGSSLRLGQHAASQLRLAHDTRLSAKNDNASRAMGVLAQNGRTRGFERTETPGFPAGATYAVCTDGVAKFKKSGIMFHPCENPSVYVDPIGKLRMMANAGSNGIWESDVLDGGWHCINPGFPPGGDCTFFFHWGKFDYIIGGFTGLWSKRADAPNSAYEDIVHKGLDFYDGLAVPAITEIPGGRFLMAGWIPVRGWGGNLVIHELIQFPDGRIGSKWMEEITPPLDTPKSLATQYLRHGDVSGRWQTLHAGLRHSTDEGRPGSNWRLLAARPRRTVSLRIASWPDGSASAIRTWFFEHVRGQREVAA